jgi:FkbM family methyltransferase
MELSDSLKRAVGVVIWKLTYPSPALRRSLAKTGMRTSPSWFKGRVGFAQVINGRSVKLTNIDQHYLSFKLHWQGWRGYEPVTMLLYEQLLQGAKTVIDIGANCGYFSMVAASECSDIRVIAFEPNPKLFRILRENVEANGFSIVCEDKAVSDHTGSSEFYLAASDMSGSLEHDFREQHQGVQSVTTVTLDDYLRGSDDSPPMIIKIDVEGHEQSVLRGAGQTLEKYKPDLILEVLAPYSDDVEQMLVGLGYSFYSISPTGLQPSARLVPVKGNKGTEYNNFVTVRAPEQVQHMYERYTERIELLETTRL